MRKRLTALLLAGLVLLAAGCGQQTSAGDPAAEQTSPEEGFAENAEALYDFGTVQIGLPVESLDLLIVETGGDDCGEDRPLYPRELMRVYEKASVEAAEAAFGDSSGTGFLWGIVVMDQAAFEQFLQYETAGCHIFARSDTLYFGKTHPTDVQFFRENGEINSLSQDWQQWESLNALGDRVCADVIQRNGLTPYSLQEVWARPFTWEGQHAYVKYYPYHSFDGSTAEFDTLVLSQPAGQGEGGLWCVERVFDMFGNSYLRFPDTHLTAADYYAALQAECDAGQHPELLTPLGAARAFVSEWYGVEATEENTVLTDGIDSDYTETNQAMSRTVSALLVRPETVTDEEVLDCIGSFRGDTWGVMGRNFYGSDWWPPLQAALESAAVGDGQTERDRSMMSFYLTSYGRYAEFTGGLLKQQRKADPEAFQTALEEFSPYQQKTLLAAADTE